MYGAAVKIYINASCNEFEIMYVLVYPIFGKFHGWTMM